MTDAQRKKEAADERLKKIRDERAGALARKKALDDAHDKTLQSEAEIARLEEELARLKGDAPPPPKAAASDAKSAPMALPAAPTPGGAATKPGI